MTTEDIITKLRDLSGQLVFRAAASAYSARTGAGDGPASFQVHVDRGHGLGLTEAAREIDQLVAAIRTAQEGPST